MKKNRILQLITDQISNRRSTVSPAPSSVTTVSPAPSSVTTASPTPSTVSPIGDEKNRSYWKKRILFPPFCLLDSQSYDIHISNLIYFHHLGMICGGGGAGSVSISDDIALIFKRSKRLKYIHSMNAIVHTHWKTKKKLTK